MTMKDKHPWPMLSVVLLALPPAVELALQVELISPRAALLLRAVGPVLGLLHRRLSSSSSRLPPPIPSAG